MKAPPATPRADVVLISMPFGPVFGPSLGLGLLKAQLARRGISCRARYFTIAFAEVIGDALYDQVAFKHDLTVREMAGEWLFSGALYDQSPAAVERYVDRILRRREGALVPGRPVRPSLVAGLLRARARVAPFLDRSARDVLAMQPRIVGFTSVFQQHVASIAVSRRIKQARPDVLIIGGGANCEGPMGAETLRQFPWIDAVVSGEGDDVFPTLVERVLAGLPLQATTGVRTRASLDEDFSLHRFESTPPIRDLDALPYPDYEDYFADFGASRFQRTWQPQLFAETSRGCWWGERSHCTFCGLNGATMTYRSKSPARALAELTDLAAKHPGSDLQVVDNILDMKYLKTLMPALAERKIDVGLFYETKSNLKKEHIALLRDAGVRHIQPGIESFSDDILKLMRKGVTGLQNIQVLKWCRQFGVHPIWNLLWGTPGEPPAEYEAMAALVPLLTHLPPPSSSFGLRLDRFSPNFNAPAEHGVRNLRPLPVYAHLYDVPEAALPNLAYYFDFDYVERRPQEYVQPLLTALNQWRRRHASSELFSVDSGDSILVWDLRAGRPSSLTALHGPDRLTYLRCDTVRSEAELIDGATARGGEGVGPEHVRALLARLTAAGLLARAGGRYLSLAVPLGDHQPGAAAMRRFTALARRSGSVSRPPRAARSRLTVDDFSFDRHGALVVTIGA